MSSYHCKTPYNGGDAVSEPAWMILGEASERYGFGKPGSLVEDAGANRGICAEGFENIKALKDG